MKISIKSWSTTGTSLTIPKTYIQRIAPDKIDIVSYYNNGSPIFDQFGITKQVKAAFGKTVNLPSGAYLIVEHTEALHVIDVNSGYKSVSNNQEQNALETNLEAAEEIARQLRLTGSRRNHRGRLYRYEAS